MINLLIDRDKAPEAEVLLKEFSGLRVVLDHCLNLKAGPEFQAILADVLRLSRHKNLHAKTHFLPTGSTTGYPCADMHEACLKIIDAFGPERCVWGKRFPLRALDTQGDLCGAPEDLHGGFAVERFGPGPDPGRNCPPAVVSSAGT